MRVFLTYCGLWILLVYFMPERRSGFITVSPPPAQAGPAIQLHSAIPEVFPKWRQGIFPSSHTKWTRIFCDDTCVTPFLIQDASFVTDFGPPVALGSSV
ncbi:MAG: hypothetical protein ACI8W8_005065 [Rhodothermales bacterium]|jgi:hypothetical protein